LAASSAALREALGHNVCQEPAAVIGTWPALTGLTARQLQKNTRQSRPALLPRLLWCAARVHAIARLIPR
jgi:hypothetical protein